MFWLFEQSRMRITDEVIERGEVLGVMAMQIQVMDLDDLISTKLLALDEHSADYRDLILITRSLREQIDWAKLREQTSSSPFAAAFFVLAEGLEISPTAQTSASS